MDIDGEIGVIAGKDTGDGKSQPVRQSFKEKLLGQKGSNDAWKKADMIKEKLIQIEHEDDNMMLPKCIIDDFMFKELWKPWGETLIPRFWGRRWGSW